MNITADGDKLPKVTWQDRGDPPPGSPEAKERGCKCPVLDNAHGKGCYGDGAKFSWWISGRCEMHCGGTSQ